MSASAAPRAPRGLGPAGRRLWAAVLADFDLAEQERLLLREAARTADHLDALEKLVADEGLTAPSSQGVRTHPALVEARQQRDLLRRLLSSLRVPAELDDEPGEAA